MNIKIFYRTLSEYIFEIEMKLKELENCESSASDPNKNSNYSQKSNTSNFMDNNANSNNNYKSLITFEVEKHIINEELIRKIQKNYVDYYLKNMIDMEKYRFYNQILNSINYENKEPQKLDLVYVDRLFSLTSDDNPPINLNSSALNGSVIDFLFK